MSDPSVPPRGFRGEVAAMARIAAPVVVVQVGWMAMGVVDTLVVGRVSADAMAAVALGNLLFLAISIFGMGVLMGLDPVMAQAIGAGERIAVARNAQRGLVLIIGLTLLSTVALLPVHPLVALLGQPPEVVPLVAGYAYVAIGGFLPFYVSVLARVLLQATGNIRPMVWAMVAANVLNLGLNWVFVFGHLGMPALGAIGSSWATMLSRWALAAFLVAFAWRYLGAWIRPWRPEVLDLGALGRLLRLGAPIGLQYELELGIFSLVGVLMGRLGAGAMAANQVALNLSSITFMVPLGVSIAGAVLVGQAIGRGDSAEARRAAMAALVCGVGFMLVSGITMLAFPKLLARAYTSDATVQAIATTLIPLAGVFQVFDGTQVVSIGILRGTGDTRTPLVVNVVGYWLIGLPLAAYLGLGTALGPQGFWWGLVVGLAVVALILVARVRARLRGRLERLVVESSAPAGA
ncbi:MAG TPA: MATE family efflux transporter [Gemmatimonadales bacterium]|nr:MATE family efflux transporter [Gemmatimonadales bacterium]